MNNGKGIKRIIAAFTCSFHGFRAVYASEEAFRQELIACLVLFPISLFLKVTIAEHCLLIGSLFLVLIVEILNTAIEKAIDRISSDHHDLSKKAKDMGSAAVFLSIMAAVITWGVILISVL